MFNFVSLENHNLKVHNENAMTFPFN